MSQIKGLFLHLGRHETTSAGMWVYARGVAEALLAELFERKDVDALLPVTLAYGGRRGHAEEVRALAEQYRGAPVRIKELPTWCGRRLGMALDFWSSEHAAVAHGLANMVPIRGAGKKVCTMHDLFQAFPFIPSDTWYSAVREKWYKRLIRRTVEESDAIVTVHASVRDEISRRYFCSEKAHVILPGLDSTFLIEPNVEESVESKKFLAFASRDRRKNIATLCRAFAEVMAPKGYSLCIVATSPAVAENVAAALLRGQWHEAVDVRVNVPREQMPYLFRSSRALLFPSVAEGFGYPIYEALSQGVPVLCQRGLILPDVAGAHAGLVVERDCTSYDSICEGLQVINGRNPSKRERLEAAQAVRARLDFRDTARKLLELYKGIM